MSDVYYVIKCLMDESGWNNRPMVYHYAYGKSTYISWSADPGDARKFKSITEIRGFITRGLKSGNDLLDINSWVFEGIFTIPNSDIITASHTMGLLRSVK